MFTTTHLAALAALAPYYPVVETTNEVHQKPPQILRGRIISIDFATEGVLVKPDGDCPQMWFSPDEVKLVLKPFSALVEKLPDGTVPAVEIARMAWPHRAEMISGVRFGSEEISVFGAGVILPSLFLSPFGGSGSACNHTLIAAYLRSIHHNDGSIPATSFIID